MQSSRGAGVSDFVSVGDVNIRVIGADNQVLDSEVPVRRCSSKSWPSCPFRPSCWGYTGRRPNA